jgi:hypothetical protein
VHVDGAFTAAVGLVPDLLEDLALRHDLAGPLGEEQEQVELTARQLEVATGQRAVARRRVDDELADGDRLVGVVGGGAAQHGPDPRLELVHAERLHDVVVGTGVEGLDDRGVVVARGHHDDGGAAHGAQHGEQTVSVEVGQAQVEQHEVGLLVEGVLQPDHPGGRAGHRVAAVGQRTDERGSDPRVVLDHEHVCHIGNARAGRG